MLFEIGISKQEKYFFHFVKYITLQNIEKLECMDEKEKDNTFQKEKLEYEKYFSYPLIINQN